MLDQTIEAAEDRVSAGAALAVSFARSSAEVLEAQRLRCRLFAEEMGARIPGVALGTDCDLYDTHCQNLLVRDTGSGEVVGTYRLLQGQKEREIGSFYADGEFDLTRIQHLRDTTVEIG
ncbi:MAG: GNAT family N-acetyltransferase, partial [Burkholderiales bacterium]